MEKCKYCGAELEDGSTHCVACGQDNSAPAPKVAESSSMPELELNRPTETPEPKPTAKKTAIIIASCVCVLAIIVAVIFAVATNMKKIDVDVTEAATEVAETTEATIPADGNPADATCKGTYTVADPIVIAQKDTVVATMGENTLSNRQLQPYYWMEVQGFMSNYGAYAAYFGLDFNKPLDTQTSIEGDGLTWQQYFLQAALNNWQQLQAMANAATENGLSIAAADQEYLDHLEENLTESAETMHVSLEELVAKNIGAGADLEDFKNYQETYLLAMAYYDQQVAAMNISDSDLSKYFDEHVDSFNGVTKDSKLVDVRHILLSPEGGTTDENGQTTYSDEEWATCEQKAQEILDGFLKNKPSEENFAALANEHSQDPGSNQNGGLYTGVTQGQMVETFNDWCFDAARKSADTGLVKTDYGYHIMYFVDSQPQWPEVAQQSWLQEQIRNFVAELVVANPMEVSYADIVLGLVDFNAQ